MILELGMKYYDSKFRSRMGTKVPVKVVWEIVFPEFKVEVIFLYIDESLD